MPVIRSYSSQVRAPGPSNDTRATAEQNGAPVGRAIESLGKAVQDVGMIVAKRKDQENTSDVTAKMSEANAELAVDLQNTIRTAEPGDKKAFEDFDKRAEERLGKVGELAETENARSFFNEASARIKGQLAQTSAHGQAELAGIKAINDYSSTLNSLSAASTADPSSMQLQRDMHAAAISNLVASGQLPRSKAIQLQQDGEKKLAVATVRGWAKINPGYAKEKLKSGEFDKELGSEGKLQLESEITQAERATEIEDERRLRENEKAIKLKQQSIQNEMLSAMVEGKLTSRDILDSELDAFGSGSKEQFLNMLKTANSAESRLKTDGTTMVSLFNRINLPDGDPNKITDENELNKYFGNGLSMPDLNRLRDEMQGKQTEAGKIENDLKKQVMDIARGQLTKSNPLTGFRDPVGDEQMQKFMVYFLDEYKARRAKGESATSLLDPDSPTYLGKAIKQYVRTPQQIMQDMVRKKQTPAEKGKIKVSNGKETLLISPADLDAATKDGYSEVKE
ncbi:MAG: hypothetical protein KDA17_00505 [Candidatus Saccharibacteria bacterium]|nr:hypothetical protein [Candidatus Saccharibacteria bacterium]